MNNGRFLCTAMLIALEATAWLGAETSAHQRLGVEGREVADFFLEEAFSLAAEASGGPSGDYTIDSTSSLEFRWKRALYLGLSMPTCLFVSDARGSPLAAFALGDPGAQVGLSFRAGDSRVSIEAGYTHPLGIAGPYESEARGFSTGSAYQRLALSTAATFFSDPLALSARFEYEVGLPRADAAGSTWRPADIALTLSAMEALNSAVAWSVALNQGLSFPAIRNGLAAPGLPRYSATLSLALLLSSGDSSLRVSFAKSLSAEGAPQIGIGCGQRFPVFAGKRGKR